MGRDAGDNVLLAVEDDGIGWTGEGEIRGTGLGSRIVRAMATNLRSALSYARGSGGHPGCPGVPGLNGPSQASGPPGDPLHRVDHRL